MQLRQELRLLAERHYPQDRLGPTNDRRLRCAAADGVKLGMDYSSNPSSPFPFLGRYHLAIYRFRPRFSGRKCDANKQASSQLPPLI
jgi:hypothetical protein